MTERLYLGDAAFDHADAPVDLQPCGTHVRRTGEIGRLVVLTIENKGRQNRRVALGLAEQETR